MTWKEFFKYNEYQLKIQSDKEPPMFYQMRNEINFQYFGLPGGLNLEIPVSGTDLERVLMTPKKPVIFDTFITAYDYLSFTISRNALMPTASNYGPVKQTANEKPIPFGINLENVLLEATFTGVNGTVDTINPVGADLKNSVLQTNNVFNYHQDLDKQAGNDNGSFINNPIGGTQFKHFEYVTNPLLGFEYCIIQKNEAGRLSSL